MRVVCDNCGAIYKIPDGKLVKAVNKATCRTCGHRMMIPRQGHEAEFDDEERTLIKGRQGPTLLPETGDRNTSPIDSDEPEQTARGHRPLIVPTKGKPQAPTPRGARGREVRPQYPEVPLLTPAAHRRPVQAVPIFQADDENTVWVKNKVRKNADRLPPDEQPTRPVMAPVGGASPSADRGPGAGRGSPSRGDRRIDRKSVV